uniref:A18-like helicase n=1 Tax=Iridovirus LCIVAC01 TaxID=2506607 RepID=A0A481YQP2_9VIRU|nr:MAG: A18-like helicase [Iridovirus LCIVAC01]
MSIQLKLDTISNKIRKKIAQELVIKPIEDKYNTDQQYIYPYDIIDENIYLPFYYSTNNLKLSKRPTRDLYKSINVNFSGTLRPSQKEVKKEALQLLNKTGTCVLALCTGFGKTILSIYLASKIGLKTLIIVKGLVLMKQWRNAIEKICLECSVQTLTSKSEIDDQADFYVINAINVPKFTHRQFENIGTVICDEIHRLCTQVLSKSYIYLTPRYLIGLSATPYRFDGMDVLIDLYFGPARILRKLYRPHTVYRVNTEFKPKYETTRNGKPNWNSVLGSQANSETRNKLIVDIVKFFPQRSFLILCKRVKQVKYLKKCLEDEKEDVTVLVENKSDFNVESRVLIGIIQKCGEGFDHPKLDTLLLAADAEQYYIQYLGRCFRTPEVQPVIFDLVDDFGLLKKHYNSRRQVYKDAGGTIKNFFRSFPKFPQIKN